MEVISKFTIGSDEGIADFLAIETSEIKNLYSGKISKDDIRKYIEGLDSRKMINELNDLSNQLIITYADQQPVGYSILKSGSAYSGFSGERRITELKLIILPEYDTQEIRSSLWKKTWSAVGFTDIVWTNILTDDPLLDFFKETGFVISENRQIDPFSLPSYLMEMEVNKK